MTPLRTPRRGVLGLCLIARAPQRVAVESPELRAFFRFKLRSHQRTLILMRLARALRAVRRSDPRSNSRAVRVHEICEAIKVQSEARLLDDAAAREIAVRMRSKRQRDALLALIGDAARLMGTGLMSRRAA